MNQTDLQQRKPLARYGFFYYGKDELDLNLLSDDDVAESTADDINVALKTFDQNKQLSTEVERLRQLVLDLQSNFWRLEKPDVLPALPAPIVEQGSMSESDADESPDLLDKLRSDNAELEVALTTANVVREELDVELEELRNEKNDLVAALAAKNLAITHEYEELDSKEQEIVNLQEQTKEVTLQVEENATETAELQYRLSGLRVELENLKTQNKDLQSQLDSDIASQLDSGSITVDGQGEPVDSSGLIADLQEQLHGVINQRDQLEQRLQESQDNYQILLNEQDESDDLEG